MGAYQTVMVGTDGSDSSYRAVERAAEVARDSAARLVIVCAYSPATAGRWPPARTCSGMTPTRWSARLRQRTRCAPRPSGRPPGARVPSKRLAVEGEPVKSLLGAIDEHRADLLVVGNRGLNTLAGRLLGSVPADVSRRAPCDVLIVHTVR